MRFLNPPLCPHAGCSPLRPSPEKVVREMRQALAGRRILVVEDDPFIGLDIQGVLERAGATVVGPADNVPEALRLLVRMPIDAAVLDFRLQEGDTLPLASALGRRGIPFLFQTSDPESAAGAHPAAAILGKPFRASQLVSAVATLLDNR
jgi:CheY-like chemotaxis protein